MCHVIIKKRHGKTNSFLMLKKRDRMRRAMVERHAGATCKKNIHSNVEVKPSHEGRHGSAMSAPWERHVMQKHHGGKMFLL